MRLLSLTLENILAFKKKVLLVMGSLILAKLAAFGSPFILKNLIDKLSEQLATNDLYLLTPIFLVISYGLCNLLMLIFNEIKEYLSANISHEIIAKLGINIFEKVHQLPIQFHLKKQSGILTREIDRGIRAVQLLTSIAIHSALPTFIEFFIILIYFLYSYTLAFSYVLLTTLLLYFIFTILITKGLIKKRIYLNESDSNLNHKLVDTLLNIENVKLFGNEKFELSKFSELSDIHLRSLNSIYRTYSFLSIGQQLIVGMGICSILWLTVLGIQNSSMTIGDLVLVSSLVLQVFLPLSALGVLYKDAKQSTIDVQKLLQILQFDDCDNELLPGLRILQPNIGPKICFKSVSFHFEKDREILKDISFEIAPGSTVALVGHSGSGKSTIAKLLFGLYKPITGEIAFDDQNINTHNIKSLRSSIAVVPQDISLFNGSIIYNLRYGNFNASTEDLVEAAKAAKLHDFILSLPDKYETIVGERGLMLSGGERQRLGIARALLKKPSLLILDEATSSLDSKTEYGIHASLEGIIKKNTTLIIAHRLSTIISADKIIVLDDGKIAEIGSHNELLTRKGIYASLWLSQLDI